MTSEKTYNGWTNYETWNVKLWIDNDEGSYNYWKDAAQEAFDATDDDDTNEERSEEATLVVMKQLESEIEDSAPELQGCYADLLNAALSEVNWHEIAAALVEEADKPEPEEDDDSDDE